MPRIPPNTTVDEAVEYCRSRAPDRENYHIICWSIEDVKSEAESNDICLTDEQAQEVLRYFAEHYDYVWEVSWNLMAISIMACFPQVSPKEIADAQDEDIEGSAAIPEQ